MKFPARRQRFKYSWSVNVNTEWAVEHSETVLHVCEIKVYVIEEG